MSSLTKSEKIGEAFWELTLRPKRQQDEKTGKWSDHAYVESGENDWVEIWRKYPGAEPETLKIRLSELDGLILNLEMAKAEYLEKRTQ